MDELATKKKSEDREIHDYVKSKLSNNSWVAKIGAYLGGCLFLAIILTILVPGIWIALIMWVAAEPARLPYNGIDLQKIAYLNNKFVMYGIDYNRRDSKMLVIFSSPDGKEWTKADIDTDKRELDKPYLNGANLSYFNGKCMLFGTDNNVLVAEDCQHWYYQAVNLLESNNNHQFLYPKNLGSFHMLSTTINQQIYVANPMVGLYRSNDGITWQQESLPCFNISGECHAVKQIRSIASGDNKLLVSGTWWRSKYAMPARHDDVENYIYVKDLNSGKWSSESVSGAIDNLTRGKDRFVGMSESMAWVLVDGSGVWEPEAVRYNAKDLTYGLDEKFIGVSGYLFGEISYDGKIWHYSLGVKYDGHNRNSINDFICTNKNCIGSGDGSYLVLSADGETWSEQDFKFRNSKPWWFRKYINIRF